MKKFPLIICLSFFALMVNAQKKAPLAIEDYYKSHTIFDSLFLFDLNEIKQRKITSAYIIFHPGSWAEYDSAHHPCNCPYNDTISIYKFDNEARIVQYINHGIYPITYDFDTTGFLKKETRIYPTKDNKTKTKVYEYSRTKASDSSSTWVNLIIRKNGVNSIVVSHVLFKSKKGIDTVIIKTETYNRLGRLIEIANKNFYDDTGIENYHYKYNYDENGRLTYFKDFKENIYEKISYPFYGEMTESYEVATNTLKNKKSTMINNNKGTITITWEGNQIVLTALEENSKLFKLRTIITGGDFPILSYHEIVYK